ncbi:MAG TPA: hypothetical protein VK056_00745 [Bacillota bacterium]|nr:hypothetical protein [Bacillota bacterium]
MIVQIKGKVKYAITLDPTVWIFDKRKIVFEELFDQEKQKQRELERHKKEEAFNAKNPPVNRNIKRERGEELLANSYAMPIEEFLANAEVESDATYAVIQTTFGDEKITLEQLQDCYLLFSYKGKPLKDDGPVYLYFKDGSNKDNPIKGVQQIILQG